MNKKLYRNEYHKMIGGVCSGLADYFEIDVTVVRLLFVVAFFAFGTALVAYIVLWIVLPRNDYNYFNNPTVDYTVPPQQPGQPFNTPPPANQFAENKFGGNPFADNPQSYSPGQNPHRQHAPTAAIIIGVIMILIGGAILIDNYDLIPDFDMSRLWPLTLVAVGAVLLLSARKKEPLQKLGQDDASKNDENTNTEA
jgi:phage shock protein C